MPRPPNPGPACEMFPIPPVQAYVVRLGIDLIVDGRSPEDAVGLAATLTTQAMRGARVTAIQYLTVEEV